MISSDTYLLSSQWPKCLSAHHFGFKSGRQFAAYLYTLPMILLTVNRTAMTSSNITCICGAVMAALLMYVVFDQK